MYTDSVSRPNNKDAPDGESNSIQNQNEFSTRGAARHSYTNLKILVDDKYTGTISTILAYRVGFAFGLVAQSVSAKEVDRCAQKSLALV